MIWHCFKNALKKCCFGYVNCKAILFLCLIETTIAGISHYSWKAVEMFRRFSGKTTCDMDLFNGHFYCSELAELMKLNMKSRKKSRKCRKVKNKKWSPTITFLMIFVHQFVFHGFTVKLFDSSFWGFFYFYIFFLRRVLLVEMVEIVEIIENWGACWLKSFPFILNGSSKLN